MKALTNSGYFFPEAASESQQAIWKGILEGFLQLVSVFIEASQNFIFYFLHNKAAKNLKTIIGAHTESTDFIFKTLQKTIHLVTQSL
jgi:hypothetical protein